MLDGLIGYLKEFFFWMWDWVINWFYDAFASIAAYFLDLAEVNGLTIDPSDLTDKINTLYSLLDTVNQWLPIHAVIGLVTVEWSIRLSIRGVRWIIGFIPTVEG